MRKIIVQVPKPHNVAARALADGRFKHRIVHNRKKYSRKGRDSSMRKFEDSVQFANGRGLIEILGILND